MGEITLSLLGNLGTCTLTLSKALVQFYSIENYTNPENLAVHQVRYFIYATNYTYLSMVFHTKICLCILKYSFLSSFQYRLLIRKRSSLVSFP